jgi:hypothetical protein
MYYSTNKQNCTRNMLGSRLNLNNTITLNVKAVMMLLDSFHGGSFKQTIALASFWIIKYVQMYHSEFICRRVLDFSLFWFIKPLFTVSYYRIMNSKINLPFSTVAIASKQLVLQSCDHNLRIGHFV